MKKKINIQFLLIAFLAIAATWVFAAVVFYEVVCREIMDDLKGYAKLLAATRVLEQMEEGDSSVKAEGLRISLIKAARYCLTAMWILGVWKFTESVRR